jgi:hypothetical protein
VRNHRFALAVSVVTVGLAGAASAAPVSPVSLQILVDGENAGVFDESALGCSAGAGETFHCAGSGLGGLDLTWDMTFDSDPGVTGDTGIAGITGITNSSFDDQRITLIFTLPTLVASESLMGGDVQGEITDNVGNGSTISAPAESALYTARIDGVPQQTLFADPFSFTGDHFLTESFGSQSWGTPIPSAPGPAVASDIELQLDFTLSGIDSASLTSQFQVVAMPEPEAGTSLVLAFGLLYVLGRRRYS